MNIEEVKKKSRKCPKCGGSGFLDGDIYSGLPCVVCGGSGRVSQLFSQPDDKEVREMKCSKCGSQKVYIYSRNKYICPNCSKEKEQL